MIEKEGARARDNTAAVNRKREWSICGFFRDSQSPSIYGAFLQSAPLTESLEQAIKLDTNKRSVVFHVPLN